MLAFLNKGSLDLSQPASGYNIPNKMSQKELARSEFKEIERKISDTCSDLDPSLSTKQPGARGD